MNGWPAQILGTLIAALVVGYLLEFSRSEEVRTSELLYVWSVSLATYLIPSIWFTWRTARWRMFTLVLIAPMLGTLLLQLLIVTIPNGMPEWWSPFVFFVVFYTTVSGFIVGLTHLVFFAVRRLGKIL